MIIWFEAHFVLKGWCLRQTFLISQNLHQHVFRPKIHPQINVQKSPKTQASCVFFQSQTVKVWSLPREHFIGCQVVKMFLLKALKKHFSLIEIFYNSSFVTICVFEFDHNLSFWVVTIWVFSFVTIWVVKIWVFEFHHSLSFCVSSQFEFLSFITIWVFDYDHNLSFWVSSQF